jgi:surfactin synthase thioesterase subunit
MQMLVDEVPRWVGTPVAALGISMGAFGALRLARKRHDRASGAAPRIRSSGRPDISSTAHTPHTP